jgi:hypothetical protein
MYCECIYDFYVVHFILSCPLTFHYCLCMSLIIDVWIWICWFESCILRDSLHHTHLSCALGETSFPCRRLNMPALLDYNGILCWQYSRTPVSNFAPTNDFVVGTLDLKWVFGWCLNTSSNMMSRIGGKEGVTSLYNKKSSYDTKYFRLWRVLFSIQNLWVTSMRYFGSDFLKRYFSGWITYKKHII